MCPDRRPRMRRQRGFGLIAAVFTITAVALMAVMVTRMVRTGAEATSRELLSLQAFAAAESGAHLALNRLFAPVGSSSCAAVVFDLDTVGLERCAAETTCTSEVVDGDTWYTIASTGTCDVGDEITSRSVVVRANP